MPRSNAKLEWNGNIAILSICRPEQRNALNLASMDEIATHLDELENTTKLRALIIMSEGEKSFVAGGDLKEFNQLKTQEQGLAMAQKMASILNRLEYLPVPVIAAMEGDAYGGGWELLCACDIRIGSEKAKIGFRQAHFGLTPGWGGTTRLIRLVGFSQASYLLQNVQNFKRVISKSETQIFKATSAKNR